MDPQGMSIAVAELVARHISEKTGMPAYIVSASGGEFEVQLVCINHNADEYPRLSFFSTDGVAAYLASRAVGQALV